MMTREEALRELKFMQTGVHMDTWSRDAVTWAIAALEAEPEPLAKVEGRIIRQESGGCVLLAVGLDIAAGLKPGDGRDVRVIILEEQET